MCQHQKKTILQCIQQGNATKCEFWYYILDDHANKDQLKFSHKEQLQLLWLKIILYFYIHTQKRANCFLYNHLYKSYRIMKKLIYIAQIKSILSWLLCLPSPRTGMFSPLLTKGASEN